MKNLVLVSILLLTSCNSNAIKNSLKGEWEWIESSGGIAGELITKESEGYSSTIVFKADSVSFYRNNSLLGTTLYSIEEGVSIYSSEPVNFINYVSEKPGEVIIYLTKDSLLMGDNNYDGYTSLYIRKMNKQ